MSSPSPRLVELPIKTILRPRETQMREAGLDESHIEHLMEIRRAGQDYKERPIVFTDGKQNHLGDGHHRVEADDRLKHKTIIVELRQGGLRDAILCAVEANQKHGLPRKPEDKRRAVLALLQDAEWGQWANTEIAQKAGVDEKLVRKVKAELRLLSSAGPKMGVLVSRGGTIYTMQPRKRFSEMSASEQAQANNEAGRRGALLDQIDQALAKVEEAKESLDDARSILEDADLHKIAGFYGAIGQAANGAIGRAAKEGQKLRDRVLAG